MWITSRKIPWGFLKAGGDGSLHWSFVCECSYPHIRLGHDTRASVAITIIIGLLKGNRVPRVFVKAFTQVPLVSAPLMDATLEGPFFQLSPAEGIPPGWATTGLTSCKDGMKGNVLPWGSCQDVKACRTERPVDVPHLHLLIPTPASPGWQGTSLIPAESCERQLQGRPQSFGCGSQWSARNIKAHLLMTWS